MEGLVAQPNKLMMNYSKECCTFIENSPTAFQAVASIKKRLLEAGFSELLEGQKWNLKPNGKYFTSRNHSSIIAFTLPSQKEVKSFNLCASHSDVCSFKIKPEAVLNKGNYVQLNTEGYGGMLCSTWLDRPLSIAGRMMIEKDGLIKETLFDLKEPVCLIPNVAIHMNRNANDSMVYNKQIDMLPMVAMQQKDFDLKKLIADKMNVEKESISMIDGYLYNPQSCVLWGEEKEFISAPRLDDLEMAYATLCGFLEAENQESVNVYCCFDNEEVGSRTRQGAASSFLKETLKRITLNLGNTLEDYYAALANSLMVSADNAHALHPNHPEKSDELNRPKMNQGIVIKFNAAQSYTTDAFSAAYFKALCKMADVPVQTFTNRSDAAGGGTLGNISTSQVSISSVDIGLAQLSMHSTFETAGTKDIEYCVKALKEFYSHTIVMPDSGTFQL